MGRKKKSARANVEIEEKFVPELAVLETPEEIELPTLGEMPLRVVRVELPVGVIPEGAFDGRCLHVNFHADGPQGAAIRRAQIGLKREGHTLANGKIIRSGADVVRWILEQV